jgi:hypothetical protein
MLPVVHQLGLMLIGGPEHAENGVEELPLNETTMAPVTLASAPPLRRTMLIRKHGGFTSVEAQNHLLTFGEYAAMYLLAWSPRIWRGLATEDECYEHVRATGPWTLTKLDPLFSHPGEPQLSLTDFQKCVKETNRPDFTEEQQKVLVYAASVPKVARVLANTPTYMHDLRRSRRDGRLEPQRRLAQPRLLTSPRTCRRTQCAARIHLLSGVGF